MVIRDGWLEGNHGDSIQIGTWGAVVSGLRVLQEKREGTQPIRLLQGAAWANIQGNILEPAGHNSIVDLGSPEAHCIRGNFRRSNTIAGWGFATIESGALMPTSHTVEPPDYLATGAAGTFLGSCYWSEDTLAPVECQKLAKKGTDFDLTTEALAEQAYSDVVKHFGADPTGATSSDAAIQAGIKEAGKSATEKVGAIYFPRGIYRLDQPLEIEAPAIYEALRMFGDGAVLRMNPNAEGAYAVLRIGGPIAPPNAKGFPGTLITLEGLTLDANGVAEHGLELNRSLQIGSVVERVTVRGARSHGFMVTECQLVAFRNCTAQLCGGDGWRIRGCNGTQLASCRAEWNNGNGFTVTSFEYPEAANLAGGTGQCFLIGATARSNGQHGVAILRDEAHISGATAPASDQDEESKSNPAEQAGFGTAAVVVRDSWIVGNHCDGVVVSAWYVLLHGNRIMPSLGGPNPLDPEGPELDATSKGARAIRVLADTFWTNIQGNTAHMLDSGADYATVQLHMTQEHDVGEDDALYEQQPNRNKFYIQGNFRIDDKSPAPVFPSKTGFMPVASPGTAASKSQPSCPNSYGGGWTKKTKVGGP